MKALKNGLNKLGHTRNHQQSNNKTVNAERKRNVLFQENSSHTGNFEGAGEQTPDNVHPETRGVLTENWVSPAEPNNEQLPQHIQPALYGPQQCDINTPSNDYRVEGRFSFDDQQTSPESGQPPTQPARVPVASHTASGHNVPESAQPQTQTRKRQKYSVNLFNQGNKDKSLFNHNESVLADDSGPPDPPPKTNGARTIQNHAGNNDNQGTRESLQPNDESSPFSDDHRSRKQDAAGLYREQRRLSDMTPGSPPGISSAARTRHMSQNSATLGDLRNGLTLDSPDSSADSDTDRDSSVATSNMHAECQRDIAELKARRSKLLEAFNQGTERLKIANKRIVELETDKTTLSNLVQARENSLAESQQKMNEADGRCQKATKQLNNVKEELKNVEVALERSCHDQRSVVDKLRKTANDAESASSLNKWYADRVKKLENEVARQAYKLNDLQPQLKDKQEELERANRQADSHRQNVLILQSSNTALRSEVNDLKVYLSTANGELSTLRGQNKTNINIINDIQPKLARANRDLTERDDELSRLRATQIRDRDSAQQRLDACKANMATLRTDTEKSIAEARSKAATMIQMWQAEKEEQISTLKALHVSKISHLKEEHETATQDLNAQLQGYESKAEKEKAAIRTEHANRLDTITKQHETEVAELTAQLKHEQAEHQSEILELTDDLAEQLVKKAKEYEKATEQLREDVQTLNSRLLTHDDHNFQGEIFTTRDLPNSPDEILRSQFSDIVHIVDSLGRITWKAKPSVWTNDILKATDGQLGNRLLKKAIVQDTVWSVLFHHIFCSPFRMFGAEGKILEQQWTSQCGQGTDDDGIFTWPRPGAKAERWRFITVKNCRDTLLPPQPSDWDPRKKVMKEYLKNLHDCRTALIVALENFADLQEESIGHINQLPKKAATIGMNFAMHRCRIVIEMRGKTDLSMADKAAAGRNNKIELTRVPALRRYGNVMGVDLDQSQIVGNLAGDSVNVP